MQSGVRPFDLFHLACIHARFGFTVSAVLVISLLATPSSIWVKGVTISTLIVVPATYVDTVEFVVYLLILQSTCRCKYGVLETRHDAYRVCRETLSYAWRSTEPHPSAGGSSGGWTVEREVY